MPFDARLSTPGEHRVARGFGPVVADDHSRLALPGDRPGQFPNDPVPRDRGAPPPGTRHIVDAVEHAEPSDPKPSGRGRSRGSTAGSAGPAPEAGTLVPTHAPATPSSPDRPGDTRRLRALAAGVTTFCKEVLQRSGVQHAVGQQPLEPRILVFQRPQPPGLRHCQTTISRLPVVDRRCGYAVPTRQKGQTTVMLEKSGTPRQRLKRIETNTGFARFRPGFHRCAIGTANAEAYCDLAHRLVSHICSVRR